MTEELLSEMAEVNAEREKVDSLFAQGTDGVEDDLLRELDELSLNEKPDSEKERILKELEMKDAAYLDQQLADWERKLESLKYAGAD